MKRYFLISGILFLAIYPNLKAQQSGIQSLWHNERIHQATIVDYRQEDNIFYLVSNNQDYLYLNVVVPFPIEQKKILLFGLTIYIDPAGKSKKDLAIMYPFRRTGRRYRPENLTANDSALLRQIMDERGIDSSRMAARNNQNMRNPSGRTLMNFDAIKYNMADRARIMVLKGYTDTAEIVVIPSTNLLEVHGWMEYDSSGVMYYSLAVPFAKVPIKENMKKSGFSIGLETGFYNPEQSMANRSGGPGGMGVRPGGGQSRPGGGRAGGGMSSRGGMGARPQGGQSGRQMMNPEQRQAMMEHMQALSTPTKFWIKKIKLAEEE